jgi:hypothetical protein
VTARGEPAAIATAAIPAAYANSTTHLQQQIGTIAN